MAGYRRRGDIDITREELHQFGEALKKEEFRKLLVDYVEEVNDPENKKIFQKEVTQLEKERGYDVTFVNPEPGYVIKTSADGEKKAFINVCKSDKVQRPTSTSGSKDGSSGTNWSLPYSQAPPRDDLDKSRNFCLIYDVVFHPEALQLAERNPQFKKMMNETALDAVEKTFGVKLDRKNLKFPKMKYKGMSFSTVIRKKSENPPPKVDEDDDDDDDEVLSKLKFPYDELCEDPAKLYAPKKSPTKKSNNKESDEPDSSPYTTPNHSIKHRNTVDFQECTNDRNTKLNASLPNEIIVEIELPLLSSTSEAILDVTEKSLSLISEKPAKYKLDIILPFTVDEDAGNAKFDKIKRKLCVTLPLKHRKLPRFADFGREDSGVESDNGPRSPDSSSGEDDSIGGEIKKFSSIEEISSSLSSSPEEHKTFAQENVEEDARSKSLVSDFNKEVFRTNMGENKMFLDADKHYSFPPFTCNVVDSVIVFTLHVKNVDPNSVEHCLFESSCGIHIKFTSIGSGFFPIHHAFCTKFPDTSPIDEDAVSIETWDNNIIVQIQLNACDKNLLEYYTGANEDTLVKHDFPEPMVIAKQLEDLKILNEVQKTDMKVEVIKCTKEETVVEITPLRDLHSKELGFAVQREDEGRVLGKDCAVPEISESQKRAKPILQKSRTFSESSGDESNYNPSGKGILKRVSRSLSESSVDDYTWSSSLDMVMQSGSDSCIPEEEGKGVKKTVRFNEVVHQKTFRSNCSILGQRKKNQRKIRNKKRAQERRASESENSEGEADKDKSRETKTEKDEVEGEEEGKDEVEGEEEGKEEEEKEKEEEEAEEEDDAAIGEDVVEIQTKLQDDKDSAKVLGGTNPKAKKKSRKSVGGSSKSGAVVSNQQRKRMTLDLKNDLIFDLDKWSWRN